MPRFLFLSVLLAGCAFDDGAPADSEPPTPAADAPEPAGRGNRAEQVAVLAAGACGDAGAAVECEPCADAGAPVECEPLPSADGCRVLDLIEEEGPDGLRFYAQSPLPRVLTIEDARCAAAELLAIGRGNQ